IIRHSRSIVTPVKTGVHPQPLTQIAFINVMTDAVRHLPSYVAGMTRKRPLVQLGVDSASDRVV
ncbi:MAG: hypothetical protein ACXW6K_15735, partial [Candidatus Binatia bacterium]